MFCHKADPESKGKVENVVKYVKENFLVARVFRDIDSLNREALEWLERTGNREGARTTRLVPQEEFAVEKGFLMPYHGTPQPPQEGDEGIPCTQGQYSAVQGLLQPAMRNLPEQADNRLAAGNGGNVELYNKDTGNSSAGMRSVPEREGPFMTTPTENRETPGEDSQRILVHVSGNRGGGHVDG